MNKKRIILIVTIFVIILLLVLILIPKNKNNITISKNFEYSNLKITKKGNNLKFKSTITNKGKTQKINAVEVIFKDKKEKGILKVDSNINQKISKNESIDVNSETITNIDKNKIKYIKIIIK